MRIILIAASVILCVTAFSTPAYACTCVGLPIESYFPIADTIFVGEVVTTKHNENRFSPGTIEVTFKVTRAVKGTIRVGDTLTVQTSDQGSACGIVEFRTQTQGTSWIVYADRFSGSVLHTGRCSRTKRAASAAATEDIRYFDSPDRSR
jgi:hypothetical protein